MRRRDAKEEAKGGRNGSSEEEVSLTRVKQNTGPANYKVVDGEFSSYPEIAQKSCELMTARGIKSLFPIQQHTFYPIYNREDVIARDLTGSGKTLAFALPVTEWLRKNQILGCRKISAIVLAPTRELAIQVSLRFDGSKASQPFLTNQVIFNSHAFRFKMSSLG